jgi:hypothetical protein
MFKYLFALTGSGLLMWEAYNYWFLTRKRKAIPVYPVHKNGQPTITNNNEYICEYNLDDNTNCHKVVIESYNVMGPPSSLSLSSSSVLQKYAPILNATISFIHIQDLKLKLNNDPKECFTCNRYSEEMLHRDIASRVLMDRYRFDINKYDRILNTSAGKFDFIKLLIGQRVTKMYIYYAKFREHKVAVAFSDDLNSLLNYVLNRKKSMYTNLCLAALSFSLAFIPKINFKR